MIILFQIFVRIHCCCTGIEKATENETPPTKSFKNMTGIVLESAVIGEISQQMEDSHRIQLRSLKISKVTKNMMKNFSAIISIDFRGNEITEIDNETFSDNVKLEKINLMLNRLTKITKKVFHGDFEELQEINLSHNMLDTIEPGSFDKVPKLEMIDLSCNCLKHVHADVFKKNSDLREVYFQSNELVKISYDLFNSKTDLSVLDLARNEFDFVPELSLKQVKRFDLSFNNINMLDLNYSHEKKKSATIVELVVTHNQITECAELEERRTDILHLDLTSNLLADMGDFPSFLNLEVLVLANNSITDLSLHNFEDRFPSLKVLNIRANPLSCGDYKYVRNNLQSIVVTVDTSMVHRCHPNSSTTTKLDDYDIEYEDDVIINEIRSKNRDIMKHLKLNQLLLVVLISMFIVYVMTFLFSILRSNVTKKKGKKENLLDQMEL